MVADTAQETYRGDNKARHGNNRGGMKTAVLKLDGKRELARPCRKGHEGTADTWLRSR